MILSFKTADTYINEIISQNLYYGKLWGIFKTFFGIKVVTISNFLLLDGVVSPFSGINKKGKEFIFQI